MIARARNLLRAYFAAIVILLLMALSFAAGVLTGAGMGQMMIRSAFG